jgi:rare lipoprotein A
VQSRAENVLRPLAELTLVSLVAAFALALWPRPVLTTTATSQPRQIAAEQDRDPATGLDISARDRTGVASFYASSFFWKRMADGAPMNPQGNNAASRTLPLGTVAKVTDVQTGKSAVVRIEDRGPYVRGRIVDLSPATARKIGLTARLGVTQVVVSPLTVPLPGGGVKVNPVARGSDLRLASTRASTFQ